MINPSRQFAQPMTSHAVPNKTIDPRMAQVAQNIQGTPIQAQPVIPNPAAPVDPAAQAVNDAVDLNNTII